MAFGEEQAGASRPHLSYLLAARLDGCQGTFSSLLHSVARFLRVWKKWMQDVTWLVWPGSHNEMSLEHFKPRRLSSPWPSQAPTFNLQQPFILAASLLPRLFSTVTAARLILRRVNTSTACSSPSRCRRQLWYHLKLIPTNAACREQQGMHRAASRAEHPGLSSFLPPSRPSVLAV